MSNFLAVATVTATLRNLLQSAVQKDVSDVSVTVTTVKPSDVGKPTPLTGLNLYLYQVVPNAQWRNADLPTRRSDGSIAERPQAAIDLRYLISFHGDESKLLPQRLLGSAVKTLHARPLLPREEIRALVASAGAISSTEPFFQDSDLAEQVEIVRFTPAPLSLEELSKLWSVFFQTPHALSVAYNASVVLLEAQETPASALPVLRRGLYADALRQPVVTALDAEAGSGEPLTLASTLLVRGERLAAAGVTVRLGEADVTPAAADVTPTLIRVPLDDPVLAAGGLRAGVVPVRVVHPRLMGDPEVAHAGVESNAEAFVLRPAITEDAVTGDPEIALSPTTADGDGRLSGTLTIGVAPTLAREQRVSVLLNRLKTTPPVAYAFPARARTGDADEAAFDFAGVAPGTYLVRVRVDGADSVLDVETDASSPDHGRYVRPAVVIA